MKIKVTFRDSGNEVYLKDVSTNCGFDWEYQEKEDATDFPSLDLACYFLSRALKDISDSFFNSDNEISKIEFVE